MPPEWASKNFWNVGYKDKSVCYIWLDGTAEMPGPWTIWSDSDSDFSGEHEDFPIDGRMREVAWANVNVCGNCRGSCSPGKRKTYAIPQWRLRIPAAKPLNALKR